MKRSNRVGGQFSPRLIEMLESPAWRVASLSCRRVIERIEIELANHGGKNNGHLAVTKQDFINYGICDYLVAPATREAEALGFIWVKRGRGGNANERQPNRFGLTFVQGQSDNPPTHDWRKVSTIEEAEIIAGAARKAKDKRAIANGRRSNLRKNRFRKFRNRLVKTKPEPACKNQAEKTKSPACKNQARAPGARLVKTKLLSRQPLAGEALPARAEPAPASAAVAPPAQPDAEPGRRLPEPGDIRLEPEDIDRLSKRYIENQSSWGKDRADAWLQERIEEIAEIVPLESIEAEVERVKAAARLAA
jgi:hypothetical protein